MVVVAAATGVNLQVESTVASSRAEPTARYLIVCILSFAPFACLASMSHAPFTGLAGISHPGSEQRRAAGVGAMDGQAWRALGTMATTLNTLSSRVFTWRSVAGATSSRLH